ncbi:MAG TPA: nucleotide disphospho-sugar-binding domain-containing protein [Rhizobacter sp.]|nr:nucleotide disphospho-sugar-binding domain-containing protein [Rhizobacter sp.]
MKILLNTVGSHGDALPFIAIAQELQRRGHEPLLFANGSFAALATAAGVPFVETSSAEQQAAALRDPAAIDMRKGLALLADAVMLNLRQSLELMEQAHEPGRTLVVGSSVAWATRVFAERHRVPVATLHLAPALFRSEYRAPSVGPLGHLERAPRFIKRYLWSMMDRRFLDPLFAVPFNRIRAELGLPPVARVYHDWLHQADLTLGLFPEWFAPKQPDWPQGLQLTGFPLQPASSTLPAEVEAFLSQGDAPVAFTAGTANAASHAFFAASAEACRLSGRRGLLITHSPEQLPPVLPQGVMHVGYAPFDALLPRVSAFVHHGGIGTTAQALRAGVPQLVKPMGADQFDNASRTVQLGVAKQLLPRRYNARTAAHALDLLVSDPVVRERCEAMRHQMAKQNGVSAACDAILDQLALAHSAGAR